MLRLKLGDQKMWFDQCDYVLVGSSDFALYRGKAPDGSPVLLKVCGRLDHSGEHAAQLAREAQLVLDEGATWAVRPLGLTHVQGVAALRLQDPGGVPLSTIRTEALSLLDRLRLAIGITCAVEAMHMAGILHLDLRPDAILADAANGTARLMGLRVGAHHRDAPGRTPSDAWPGNLAYMAPEQSGRTSALPDARSDLYALGVVLYELMSGHLPLVGNSPMEWIHAHLAREPRPLDEQAPDVPLQLSRIISKLLRKSPDQRYQSAKGLEADLRRCLAAALRGTKETFPLGRFDPAAMLRQSGTVIGRAPELAQAIAVFEKVAAEGRSAGLLVCGEPGVGKTALVEQMRRTLQPCRLVFAAGKSDPIHAEVPYSALKLALRSLVDRLLGEEQSRHEVTRSQLRRALGDSAGLVATLVPEIEAIIGGAPADPVAPESASTRMTEALRRLLSYFTAEGQVLVLFLDDLQWADAGTIELLCALVTGGADARILIVGAVRPPPADAVPTAACGHLAHLSRIARLIPLAPLGAEAVEELVASLIQAEPAQAAPLAPLVAAATGGNPFSIGQFLSSLADDGLLTYDPALARWTWDQSEVTRRSLTDDVADLLVAAVRKLSPADVEALEWLSCLGSNVRAPVFEAAAPDAPALRIALADAVQAGFLLRRDNGYHFSHDRIRDEVYGRIPARERAAHHGQIAARLLDRLRAGAAHISIYDVTSHFNLATHGGDRAGADPARVAALNLEAAEAAKAASNYPAALGYCRHGTDLLPETAWSTHYPLMFALEMRAAECEILTGARDSADARLDAMAAHASDLRDLGAVTRLRVSLFTAMDRSDEAVASGLAYLAKLGSAWAPQRGTSVEGEYATLMARLAGRSIESLAQSPRMDDPVREGAVDVLAEVMSPASFLDPELHDLIPLRLANLSLEHGLAEASPFAFVHLAMVIGPAFGAYDNAYRFGRLGLELTARPELARFKPKVLMCFGNLVLPWTRPVREGQPLIREAFERAKATGDINFAAYSCNNLVANMLLAGDPLPHVEEEIRWGLAYAEGVGLGRVGLILKAQLMLVRTLRDGPPQDGPGSAADTAAMEQAFAGDRRLAVAEYCYWVRQLQLRVLTGRYREAQQAAARAGALTWTSPYFLETAEFHLYAGLAHALAHDALAGAADPALAAEVARHRDQAAVWKSACPDNFSAMFHLLSAETARLEQRPGAAGEHYEQAIASARRFGLPHHEALASECACAFYRQQGLPIAAEGYGQNARASYGRWGAATKLRPAVREGISGQSALSAPAQDFGPGAGSIDVATVLRASQALSQEIVLETLIERLLHLALENAGADRGALLLPKDQELEVIGSAQTGPSGIIVHIPPRPATARTLPCALINRVARSRRSVILNDAQSAAEPGGEPGAIGGARSVLCLPLMKRGELIGILYMENTLSPNVFSQERLGLLELIGAQAAISIENARLYEELQQDIGRRIAVEDDLRRTHAFLAAAQQVSGVGSWYWEDATHTVIWSDEQFRLLGYDRHQTAASFEAFWARVHPDDVSQVRKVIETAFRTRSGCSAAFRLLLPDGTVRHLESLSTPVPRPGTAQFDFVGTLMDVTERRQAEEGLQLAEAELARVSRLTTLGQLMASIAHEVNQPLAAIVTDASAGLRWLNRTPPDREEVRMLIARIVEQGTRAGDIIRGLRGLAKKSGSATAPFAFKEALDEVLALTGADLRRHRVSLVVHLTPRHPVVLGDRVQIQQVLINLVMNAAEAMAECEGPRVLSILSDKVEEDRIRIEVADTGPGISAEDAERIFDAFYTTKETGMGMGLSICRSIVEAHGGRLTVAARTLGSVFSFSLPSDTGPWE